MIGLVAVEDLTPGDMVGVNKDSYLVLEKLPAEYDSRIKAMEVPPASLFFLTRTSSSVPLKTSSSIWLPKGKIYLIS